MPAEDKIHRSVKNALIKADWTVTAEPFVLEIEGEHLYADIGAERIVAEERILAIVVEVKSFRQRSLMYALEEAWGQYSLYQKVLRETHPDYKIYLALPQAAYDQLQERATFRLLMRLENLSLIVVNTDKEEIAAWIEGTIIVP